MSPARNPRVVLYGIGQFGQLIARLAIEKQWTIVAAYNRAGPKVGQDLGRLCGLDRDLGVVVEDCDTARFEGIDADVGIVTMTNRLELNMPAYRRLIGAGLNVLCHGTESYYPSGNNPELAREIDALARSRSVTFTGGGIWDMSRIWAGILVAGPCTHIRSLFHSSITDVAGQIVSKEQALQVGVGLSVDAFMARGLDNNPLALSYKTIPEHVLAALGYTIKDTRLHAEPIVFDMPLTVPVIGDPVPAGHCVGTRIVAEIDTHEGVGARAHIELRLFKEGETEHMFWSVDGLPHTRVRTERSDSAHATAGCLFNRVRDVIAAPPGIVLISQMGPLKPSA